LIFLVEFIQNLATAKPTAAGREAYTNCAANLLVTYPKSTPTALFTNSSASSTPFSYLFVNLLLIDIRSSLPSLLEKLNTPEYPSVSERLSSALIILAFFINFLIQQMDLEENNAAFSTKFHMKPDLILKINRSIAETLSQVIEYLRDRWDAAVAGVHGLHAEARDGESHTASGSFRTLAWDSKHESASDDRFVLAAIRVLGDWLREDDGEVLRSEATSLMDMFMDLYQPSLSAVGEATFRPLVLGVLDGIVETEDGVQSLLEHNGWSILSKDLIVILNGSSVENTSECELGQHIAAVLTVVSGSRTATPEEWLDFVTGVAAFNVPSSEGQIPRQLQHLWTDVVQLASTLLLNAPPGVKQQYLHSAGALAGIAAEFRKKNLAEDVADEVAGVMKSLEGDSIFRTATSGV
jgi:hypothetical protein